MNYTNVSRLQTTTLHFTVGVHMCGASRVWAVAAAHYQLAHATSTLLRVRGPVTRALTGCCCYCWQVSPRLLLPSPLPPSSSWPARAPRPSPLPQPLPPGAVHTSCASPGIYSTRDAVRRSPLDQLHARVAPGSARQATCTGSGTARVACRPAPSSRPPANPSPARHGSRSLRRCALSARSITKGQHRSQYSVVAMGRKRSLPA